MAIKDLNKVSTVGIQIVDRTGKVICYSKGCEYIEGYRQRDVLGKSVNDLYTQSKKRYPKINFQQQAVVDRVFETEKEQRNIYVSYSIRGSSKVINVICDGYPVFSEDGYIEYIILIFSNVSDYFELINRIDELKAQLSSPEQKNINGTQYTFDQIIGVSKVFKNLVEDAKKVAQSDGEILIVGETGTGKELFAQSIHNASKRCDKKFVALNCSAIPENLMETMLFGACKGAYTGALNQKGLVEEAEGGTLFLDEINSMPLGLQAKILRLLETKCYRKVGSSEEKKCNVRFISAMNESPGDAVENEHLRLDLYYRLGTFTITIPPLRKRKKDIRCLASYFTRTIAVKFGKRAIKVSDDLMKLFLDYAWQGNVRELRHVITQCLFFASEDSLLLEPRHLKSNIVNEMEQREMGSILHRPTDNTDLHKNLEEYERILIVEALERNNNNITQTAKYLNITRQSLHAKIKKYSLKVPHVS